MWDLEEMFKSYVAWETNQYESDKSNLNNRINKIYKLFNINSSSKDTIQNIEKIRLELTTNYHIPSKYTDNLQTITNRIRYIENYKIWTNETNVEELWENLETNTPSHLVLK